MRYSEYCTLFYSIPLKRDDFSTKKGLKRCNIVNYTLVQGFFVALRRFFILLRRFFIPLRRFFRVLRRFFIPLRRFFILLRRFFIPLRRFFIPLRRFFIPLRRFFIPLRKCFPALYNLAARQYQLIFLKNWNVNMGSAGEIPLQAKFLLSELNFSTLINI